MKRLALALLLVLAGTAHAQQAPQAISPAQLTGFATLSVLAASIALSTASVGPNSPAFPGSSLPNRYIEVRNSVASASTLFVCPFGGTCTSAVGIPLAVGESKTWMIPSSAGSFTSPTVISVSTATAVVSW
jgi:hypothetical protein